MKKAITLSLFRGLVAAFAISTNAISPAGAQNFYKGKKVKMIVRSAPGGGYDFYGRLLARHMPKYIPGKPKFIVVNLPGAGGIVAANYMMQRAKKNGTEIAILTRSLALSQRTKDVGVKYDLRKLTALGSAASSTFLVAMGKNQPIQSYKALKNAKNKVLFCATGPGAGSYQYPALLKNEGFNIKIITGVIGTNARFLSIARGETHGTANSYESTRAAFKEFKLVPILYNGAPIAPLKGVPHINTYLSEQGKQLAALMGAPLAAGRPFFTTPDVSSDRVKILRAAFKSALHDKELLKEAKRAKRNVAWTDPSIMTGIYNRTLNASDKVIALYKAGAKKVYVKHTGPVTKIKKKGKRVYFNYKGKEIKIKVSGKRTKVEVKGKKVKRKAIKVGMTCKFKFAGPGGEEKYIKCK